MVVSKAARTRGWVVPLADDLILIKYETRSLEATLFAAVFPVAFRIMLV